jgi:signal peptidase I
MRDRLRAAVPTILAYISIAGIAALALHWYGVVWVAGGSMVPALSHGDVVVVAKERAPRVGDIALLKPGSSPVLHRVTRVDSNGSVWTRGDANPVADLNPSPAESVRGRVVMVLPFGIALQWWRQGRSCDTLPAQSDSAKR